MWKKSIFLVVALIAPRVFVSGEADVVYRNKAISEVSWESSAGSDKPLTLDEIFAFENAAAEHFLWLLEQQETSKGLLHEEHALSVTVNVMNQEAEKTQGDALTLLTSMVEVTYFAHEDIPSMASILQQASADEEIDGIRHAVQGMDPDATSLSVVFSDPDDPSAQIVHILDIPSTNHRSAADKGLIVACTFLSLALVAVSAVLVWAAGGFKNLYTILKHGVPAPIVQFHQDVKHTITNKFSGSKDEDDTASRDLEDLGILGAVPSSDQENAGVEVTPGRGMFGEQDSMGSPLSQVTNSTFNTDATQAPLGIRSLRKLKRYMTPDKDKKAKYNVKTMTYT